MGLLFSPRIGLKPLANLCQRLAISLDAGVDIRKLLANEAARASGQLRRHLSAVGQGVNAGESLARALESTGDYFPPIFREMTAVGEETGHLEQVFAQLADYYDVRLEMRRSFLNAIMWPMIELGFSLLIIGFIIWVAGILPGKPDYLGLGLVGDEGLRMYVVILAGAAFFVWLFIQYMQRGAMWTRPIQRIALQLPLVGRPLQTLALSRLAWSLHLTMNTGMNVRRALKLSIQSTQNARYVDQISAIDEEIMAGATIREAFHRVGGYPIEFLDTLAAGELSGKTVESMGRLAKQYAEQSKIVMKTLATIAGFFVWAAVAAVIIVVIFRMYMVIYIGPTTEAVRQMNG